MKSMALDEFIAYLPTLAAKVELAGRQALEQVATIVEDEVKGEPGADQNSISHEIQGLSAYIGSTSDRMAAQETGSSSTPPDPVFGPALQHTEQQVLKLIGDAVVQALTE